MGEGVPPNTGNGGSGSDTDPKLLIVPGKRARKAVDYKVCLCFKRCLVSLSIALASIA